jgi:hypothetical protein
MAFTAALDNTYATDAQLYQLYQATSSIQFATRSLNIQTGSQDIVNFNISTYTGSQNVINSSVDSHILKQATQTGSQDLVNLGISSVTGSLIGITNGLMAFTSALDNTYATDAQLYQLYHATASLNTQTGSQDLVNLSISTYTGSQNVINSSVDAHILKQATQTGSQDLVNLGISSVTGSLIGITNGLMAFTAALDSTYATDAQLYQLYQTTASLNTQTGSQNTINFNISVVTSSIDSHILKQATQTGSQDLVNLGISTFTGSLRSEVNGIEAYTASLKGAIQVSGQDVNVLGMITAQQFNVTYVSSSVMYQSGSTEFGDTSDDRHLFTGSLIVSGTLAAGTDETGWGRISFHEPTNRLRIQSSKNGTDCIPISFWSQATGGTFAETMVISGSGVGIGINPTQKFEVNAGQGARGGMALTGEYPYLRFNVSSSSANARNWALNATNAEAGDFAIRQSTAKDGDPVTAGTSILGFSRNGDATFGGSVTAPSVNVVYNNTLTGQTADDVTLATYTAGASNELLQITIVLTNTNATGQVRATFNYTDDANHSVSTGVIATTPNAANGVGQDVVALNIKSGTTLTIKSLITVGGINYNSRVAITKIL